MRAQRPEVAKGYKLVYEGKEREKDVLLSKQLKASENMLTLKTILKSNACMVSHKGEANLGVKLTYFR